ncbi:hypothetical protein AJ80_02143 [Polytolypa hystricis UAMH7299]|uniref:Tyrosinase copper-binding domain-containing protein n=1 Tax=Polytolypa hystricis (strain UAMH7299) TaxID=1447883 RepID=A0A2B7YQX0_POLH7|nr:hypothetical protein AJ80_02143 [Polytolypa hystricis UAMH7299]
MKQRCTKDNIVFRKEWRFISKNDRKDYIDAVYCVQSKPSLYDEKVAPGSKNLFDSFSLVHINLTHLAHGNFNFLSWHRYYVWVYEQALKECGYNGPIPYWEWGFDVDDPDQSPVFDGSPYSLGSNGAPLPDRAATYALGPPPPVPPPPNGGFQIPAGRGGGCLMKGPFSNMTCNLGPIAPASDRSYSSDWFRYNPQCLVRDLGTFIGPRWVAFNWTVWTIEESPDIVAFESRLTGDSGKGHGNHTQNGFGLHGGGHSFVGGWTGQMGDFYAAPQDPVFFLHHAQIDRVWSIWQWLDFEERREAAYGTLTFFNVPPTRNGTVDDLLDMGKLAPALPQRDIMSTIDGPFCYFYE